MLKNFWAATAMLYHLLARNNNLSIQNRLILHASILRHSLTQACMIWSFVTKTHINLLFKSQNFVIRQMYDISQYIQNHHEEINILRLNDFIWQLNFHLALQKYDCLVINSFDVQEYSISVKCKRPKTGLIHNTRLHFFFLSNLTVNLFTF